MRPSHPRHLFFLLLVSLCTLFPLTSFADENECDRGDKRDCKTKLPGDCRAGRQTCVREDRWGACLPKKKDETCNNKDDDCDGEVDENLTQDCYSGDQNTLDVGECKAGKQTCSRGVWGQCQNEVKPSKELCDGLDNDCDGQVDNDCTSKEPTKEPAAEPGTDVTDAGGTTDAAVVDRIIYDFSLADTRQTTAVVSGCQCTTSSAPTSALFGLFVFLFLLRRPRKK